MLQDAQPYLLDDGTMEIEFGPETGHAGVKLEVRIDLTIDDAITLEPLMGGFTGKTREEQRDAMRLFADELITDWNLYTKKTDEQGRVIMGQDGKPVMEKLPVTGENFVRRLKIGLAMEALMQWQKVVTERTGLSAPLETPAPSGSDGSLALTEGAGMPASSVMEAPSPIREPDAALISLLS